MIFTEVFTRKLMARTPQNGCYGGYELVDTWAKIRRIEIPRRPDLRVEHYSGYYLRDRSLS